jgi:hypothetical protein
MAPSLKKAILDLGIQVEDAGARESRRGERCLVLARPLGLSDVAKGESPGKKQEVNIMIL